MNMYIYDNKAFLVGAICLGAFIFCCAQETHAEAAQSIGQVVWVNGSVKAITNGAPRVLQRRSPIYEHDTLVTDASGTGQIVFTDNGTVSLRTNTSYKIDEYKFSPNGDPKDNKYITSLAKGGFRTVTGLISHKNPEGYEVNTPVATIGVRGTEFDINFLKGQLVMEYYKGTPCIGNAAGTFCLSKEHPYASVAGTNLPPVPITQRPAVFKQAPAKVVPASFSPTGPGPGSGPTSGTGTGGTATTPSTNTNTSKPDSAVPAVDVSPTGPSKTVGGFCVS